MTSVKGQVKADIMAITHAIIAKKIVKISKTKAEANSKLFALGEEISMRVSDEYQERETNSYKPEQIATVLLKGIMRQYLGIDSEVKEKEIKHKKDRFMITFKVIIKDNPICDFVSISPSEEHPEEERLNYFSMILGFISGCMKSMCYHPTITLSQREVPLQSMVEIRREETVIEVDMWKEKEED